MFINVLALLFNKSELNVVPTVISVIVNELIGILIVSDVTAYQRRFIMDIRFDVGNTDNREYRDNSLKVDVDLLFIKEVLSISA